MERRHMKASNSFGVRRNSSYRKVSSTRVFVPCFFPQRLPLTTHVTRVKRQHRMRTRCCNSFLEEKGKYYGRDMGQCAVAKNLWGSFLATWNPIIHWCEHFIDHIIWLWIGLWCSGCLVSKTTIRRGNLIDVLNISFFNDDNAVWNRLAERKHMLDC